jgi:hypothetical protein
MYNEEFGIEHFDPAERVRLTIILEVHRKFL